MVHQCGTSGKRVGSDGGSEAIGATSGGESGVKVVGEQEAEVEAEVGGVPLTLALSLHQLTYCKVCAKVPREWVPKRGKAGQADTSERSQEPDMHRTEGLASAQRLRPHGMPMPYFGWTRLGQGPAGMRENRD